MDPLADALALAFLAGPWEPDALAARGASALGEAPRWLGTTVREVLHVFSRPPHPCATRGPAAVVDVTDGDLRAHLRGRVAHVVATNARRGAKLMALFERITW